MSEVLIDTSAWIHFFRGVPEAVRRVDTLPADDRVATTGIVMAEVTSGARTRAHFDELSRRFAALPSLPLAADVWIRLAAARFTLARRGRQAHVADLAIAFAALDSGHRLLTRDRDFVPIADVVAVDLDLF